MRTLAIVVTLAACNQTYSLAPTTLEPDASPPPDTDEDGVVDPLDNCPAHANADQTDDDQDGFGDRCDNCPLVANPDQDTTGDDDPVGTACDPRPDQGGDCLVIFDSFSEPSVFTTHWELVVTGAAPVVEPMPGAVRLAPADASAIVLMPRDNNGVVLAGIYNPQLRARFTPTVGSLHVIAAFVRTTRARYGCGIADKPLTLRATTSNGNGSVSMQGGITAETVGDALLLRLTQPNIDGLLHCRGEYGFAAGLAQVQPTTNTMPTGNLPGIWLESDPVTLDAVAFYRSQLSTEACETVYR
jgi:hypothetical protein